MAQSLVIGIAGGTGSGKTTVAGRIAQELGSERVRTIVQDNYYRDWSFLPPDERERVNFDHPSAIDAALMGAHVAALKSGQPVDMPIYDFKTHTRSSRTVRVEPAEILIVEGILVLELEETLAQMDVKLYVETDDDLRFIRRLRRDVEERGRTFTSVIEQYLETVRPMHIEFVEKSRRNADIILPWRERNEAAIGMVTRMLRGFVELDAGDSGT